MLYVWKRSPLLRLLIPFVIGILLGVQFKFSAGITGGAVICLTLVLVIFHARKKRYHYNYRHIAPLLLFVLNISLGTFLVLIQQADSSPKFFYHHYVKGNLLEIRITDSPVHKEKSIKVIAEVLSVEKQTTSGKILLYIESDSAALKLKVDDVILIRSEIQYVPSIKNPGEFNYSKYLSWHQVLFQTYAKQSDWKLSYHPERHTPKGFFVAVRESLLEILKKQNIAEREYAVLAALVLGKTADIDSELLSAYAGVGAVHVLAVSGLHVALVYVLLSPILGWFFPKNKWKLLKALIPILVLWLYAGITGFSPSVLRAALMFTGFIIAENYQKQKNIFNTMSGSAFILLIFQPYMLMELGFLLSYVAVLGIVLLHQRISNLLFFKNKIVHWAWQLTSISISAQIATLPITVYFFHQFPNYFLLSNFIVIPLSTVILYVALAFLSLFWIPHVGPFLAELSAFLTRLMNDSMIWMSELPYSLSDNIEISGFETLALSMFIIASSYWWLWRKASAALPTCCFAYILFTSQTFERHEITRQEEICIHSIKNHSCISHVSSDTLHFYGDSMVVHDKKTQNFHLKNYWCNKGVSTKLIHEFPSMDPNTLDEKIAESFFIQSENVRMMVVNDFTFHAIAYVACDVYLIERTSFDNVLGEEQYNNMRGKTIVLSTSLSKKNKTMIFQALADNATIFDLSDGALVCSKNSIHLFDANE